MQWSERQVDELAHAGRHHAAPGVRVKALAVRAVAIGYSQVEAANLFATTRQSVADWAKRYREAGLAALEIAPGRGRKSKVDEDELERYALQTPRNFGIKRSRWTLKLLAETVPSLRGFTPAGVHQALKRRNISYKRGQPWMLSPDPDYEKKRQMIAAALEHAKRYPGPVVAVFQDEASFYRQPSQGWLWAWAGRRQPHMDWSNRSNTLVRATAWLDTVTGETGVLQAKQITVKRLIASYQELLDAYPDALMIYLIQDNWPVHFHDDIMDFLGKHPRLQIVRLPTYAPRLNFIEKLWRWTRQVLCHAHPFCDDFAEFKAQLSACFAEAAEKPAMIRHYCGLDTAKIFN